MASSLSFSVTPVSPCFSAAWAAGGAWRSAVFLVSIAREGDDLHAVQQRAGYGIRRVGGGDEQHVGEVYRHLQVVVAEAAVLLRVQGLKQGGRGVASIVGAEFVYLVEHHDGVHAPGLDEAGNEPAGHGADIGLAVAADLGLVVDAAQGYAGQFAVCGAGDAHGYAGLARSRRPHKAEHAALHARRELAHGEELDDALLDLFEAEVVLVQHLLRAGNVKRLLCAGVPGYLQAGIKVAADDAALCGAEALAGKPRDFLEELFLRLLLQVQGAYLLAVFLQLLRRVSSPSSDWIIFICSRR